MSEQETKKEMSPEEIKQMQDKMEKFYDERTPFLEKQCKYEELAGRIEAARYLRMESIAKQAHLSSQLSEDKKETPKK